MGRSLKRFSDFKVRSKIFTLTGILIASLVFMAFATKLMFNSSKILTILANEERVFSQYLKSGIDEFYHFELSGNTEDLDKALASLKKANKMSFAFARIDSIVNIMPRQEWTLYFFNVFKEGLNGDIGKAEFMGDKIKVLTKLNRKRHKEIQNIAWDSYLLGENIVSLIERYNENKTSVKLNSLQIEFNKVHTLTNNLGDKIYSLNDYISKSIVLLLIFLVVLLATFTTIVTSNISKSISEPIKKLTENFKQIASGNLTTTIEIDTKNEIGELSIAFSKIQEELLDIVSHSKKVAEGNYGAQLKPKSDIDELSLALNKMAAKLDETKKLSDKEKWLQNGLGGLDDQMRGNFTVRELAENIIKYLSKLLEIEIGAIYVFDEVLEHLEFAGSIGLNKKNIKEIIFPGEGLIGKAALQNSIQIIDTKNKYHKIFSATGEIIPERLYLLPLHFNSQIQAVIELAAINNLSELKIEFLNLAGKSISVNLSAAVARFRFNEIYDKTQEQKENLQVHEIKLKNTIDEMNKIQSELIQEKLLIDTLLENIPDTIYFKDIDSKFLKVSKSMLAKFKAVGKENYKGLTDFDIQDPELAKLAYENEQNIIKTRKPKIGIVETHINADGTKRYVISTKMPYFDKKGKILGTFGISRDITELKNLEIEIKEQNEKLHAQQEKLKTTNEELRVQEEELKVANEELAEQTTILTESAKSLQTQQEELRVSNEELEYKSEQLGLQKKDIALKNEKLIKTQKELENNAKELEQASQYKSEFLANMSHELRTPLNSMLILSKLLGNNKKGNLTDDQIKSANIIYKSGKDLLDLINEILDLSKIEAGKMIFEFANTLVEDIKTEIIYGFKPVAENKGLNFEINQSDSFPKVIYTDKQRLMQIIKNLLSNAFKFTSSGSIKVNLGIPSVETKFQAKKLNSKNSYFISVEDSGVGIHQSKVDEIFEAFQQADGSTSRKFGGTGLGLSISKQLTRVLGGEIHVESSENIGSVFTVNLPFDLELDDTQNINKDKEKLTLANTKKPNKKFIKESNNDVQRKIEIELPVFIDDDRDSLLNRLMVLIIHSEKEKASQLLKRCNNRKFNAVASINIVDGIMLAEKYSPKAIIISAELHDPKEFNKLKKNKFTSDLPVHLVSR
ncbi:MAG: HAMP domain-containing protein, partial [Prolixibacteraceae bacterium]|nr:HAMP domain-containing protein [Prolixibacteraceae bacterium]